MKTNRRGFLGAIGAGVALLFGSKALAIEIPEEKIKEWELQQKQENGYSDLEESSSSSESSYSEISSGGSCGHYESYQFPKLKYHDFRG